MRTFFLFCGLFLSLYALGQEDSTKAFDSNEGAAGERRLDDMRGALLSYANDVFARTDRYFTQGVELSVFHPAFSRLDWRHFLTPIRARNVVYHATILHESWTPSSIRSDTILRGDRPYAAVAALGLTGLSYDQLGRGTRIQAALTLGVIGPPALGREIQTGIHRATGDYIPLGWQHQIRTDVVLNYRLDYHYRLLRKRMFELRGVGAADAGTLQCKLAAGMWGKFSPMYKKSFRFQPSLTAEISGTAVGYDARLQGGVFNQSSPYVLQSRDIARLVGYARLHAQFQSYRSGLGAEYVWLTREFKTGLPHAWGRLYVYHFLHD